MSARPAGDVEEVRAALAGWAGAPQAEVRAVLSPYRACPLGAHVDHQKGPVLGMGIGLGTTLAFAPAEGATVRVRSRDFAGEAELDLAGDASCEGWARYLGGAGAVLRERLPRRPRGFLGELRGDLPGGGLSSSASVLVAYLLALAAVNEVTLEPQELVTLARRAENEFVGVQSGVLDPASVVGARRGRLLEIDTATTRWRAVEAPADTTPWRLLIAFSGRSRELSSTPFNRRVAQCRSAAARIAERAGLAPVDSLGDLPEALLEAEVDALPDDERGRARHFVEERRRVREGVVAWAAGDLARFGRLMFDSCRSSLENYGTGSGEQVALQEILADTSGVLGARFSGAGYGGCSVALVEAGRAAAAGARVLAAYRDAFPEHAERAQVFVVESADGAHLA